MDNEGDFSTTEQEPLGVRQILRIRDFRLLWLGQIVSNFGDSLTAFTIMLYVNRVTDGSPRALALLLISLALPHAVLGLGAGAIVDRFDRKRIMIIADLLRGFLTLALVPAMLTRSVDVWPIYLLAFLHSTVSAFFTPARSAMIPRIVPTNSLLAANSLAQTSMVFFRLLGAALAGILVGEMDLFWPAATIDAVTFFVSMVLIMQIATSGETTAKLSADIRQATAEIIKDLRVGVSLIVHSRLLTGLLVGVGVMMLGLGAVNVLLAPLVVNDLHLPETWFGALEGAQALAMLLSGTAIAFLAARFSSTSIVSVGLVGIGAAIALIAPIDQIWQLVPILFVVGLFAAPLNAAIATLVQTAVEDELRGRVSAALGSMIQAASLVSMFAAGAVAAQIGVRNVFLAAGIIALVAGVLSALVFRGYEPTPTPETVS